MLVQCRQGSETVAVKTDAQWNAMDLLPVRPMQRIRTVRRQLEQGTYNLDPRLDAILEKILMDLSS
jgi:hypothetical protein